MLTYCSSTKKFVESCPAGIMMIVLEKEVPGWKKVTYIGFYETVFNAVENCPGSMNTLLNYSAIYYEDTTIQHSREV